MLYKDNKYLCTSRHHHWCQPNTPAIKVNGKAPSTFGECRTTTRSISALQNNWSCEWMQLQSTARAKGSACLSHVSANPMKSARGGLSLSDWEACPVPCQGSTLEVCSSLADLGKSCFINSSGLLHCRDRQSINDSFLKNSFKQQSWVGLGRQQPIKEPSNFS